MAVMDYSLVQRIIDGTGQILDTTPGSPDSGSYVTEAQLRDWIKAGILFSGYYYNGNFYSDSGHTSPLAKVEGALYVDKTNSNKALYVCLSSTYQSLTEEAQVQAIIDGLNDGTIVPLKAKQDQNGNVIDTTYETKADANDLKNALEDSEQRIENLEQAVSGSLVTTNTDATQKNTKTITSANTILPWALLNRVGARATQWNQLINKDNFTATRTENNVTFTNNGDGSVTIVTTAEGASANTSFSLGYTPIVNGHKYFMNTINSTTGLQFKSNYTDSLKLNGVSYAVLTCDYTTTNNQFLLTVLSGTIITTAITVKPQVFDLTAMNEASLTADQFRALFPASYYPHNAGGIIPLNPSGFKVVGKQKWDEVWEYGGINSTNGNELPSSVNARSVEFIPLRPNTAYYILSAQKLYYRFYDKEKNYLGFIDANGIASGYNTSMTTPSACYYFRFVTDTAIADNSILICLNSVTDKTYEGYSETTLDTSFTDDYLYVNENCHDYSENVLVDGQKMREEHKVVGSYTFKGNETWADAPNFRQTLALQGTIKPVVSNDVFANLICPVLVTVKAVDLYNGIVASGISVTSDGRVRVGLNDVASLTGKTIYFELATPTTSLHNEPIPNFPSEDGTTITAITPQTDLVNAIDVPNTIAYMTKIGG